MRWPSLFVPAALTLATAVVGAQEYPALVATYAVHQGGNVVYHYEVRNGGDAEVRRFYVGCDCRPLPYALPELQVLPVGASKSGSGEAGTWYELPTDAVQQPPGWRARLATPRGASGYWLEWYMPAARANAGIAAGRALGGFRLVLPQADEAYLSGRFTVIPEGGREPISAPLALIDTTPPTLSLQAGTAEDRPGETALLRVIATAKDDVDPEPRVVLESVGRTDTTDESAYAVLYSATDASGNRATASARVRLPAPNLAPSPALPGEERPPAGPVQLHGRRLASLP